MDLMVKPNVSSTSNIEFIDLNPPYLFSTALLVEGEMLSLTKITRSEMGAYMCIASNGVPPSVSKRMKLQVHCKFKTLFIINSQINFHMKY